MRIESGVNSYILQNQLRVEPTEKLSASTGQPQEVNTETDGVSISKDALALYNSPSPPPQTQTQEAIPPNEPLTGNGDGNP